ncbi:WD-40 repeat-containing protein [Reticulomyxa filosa]|uniref:WD-40 repeat-containing protein n=1 Tax=Reticulomyxa filosa TaxID=46433 RepID=X6MMV5_RETFI|nr:WD-40 repeat-containing protein [Reticulomyxa filosa]|eukprot:ETO14395.1 WD-40 repeat-containing protein [Reticulomyxa filosa]
MGYQGIKDISVFNAHKDGVTCIDISPLQNNSKNNNIGVIGGNGYTLCSVSFNQTICTYDIETNKLLNTFKKHTKYILNVKYRPNELDIRSGQQIQVFRLHKSPVYAVEYSPFVIPNNIGGNSNVICSGSCDNTIQFWDIRSNKNQLYIIKGR